MSDDSERRRISRPSSLERRACAFRHHFPLMLSYSGENLDRQFVGMGIVNRDELHTRIHQGRNEGEISGQPVERRDDELGLLLSTDGQSLFQFRAVVPFAGLDFGELADQLPVATIR